MSKLEDLQPNASVRGVLPDALVSVVNAKWFGSSAVELTYKAPDGKVANLLLYRHDEPRRDSSSCHRSARLPGQTTNGSVSMAV